MATGLTKWAYSATALCVAIGCSSSLIASPILNPSDTRLEEHINGLLQLENSWNSRLDINQLPGESIVIEVPYGRDMITLDLAPHSIRADGYQVFMQDDEGELYEIEPSPLRTLRGSVNGYPDSIVAASLMDDGLHARVRLSNDVEFWMEPIGDRVKGAASNSYAFYFTSDIIGSGGTCGAADHMDVGKVLEMLAVDQDANEVANLGDVICTTQLGVDTDYEYYQDWGSNTESRIEQVVNAINTQYEEDVALTFEITTIIVRSSSNDPYTSTQAEVLLEQFRSEWQSNQGGIQRDLAHLFTGKSIQNGTIGIAWLGAVCTSNGYGLAQSDCCGSFGCTTDLSAHEMGHNFGAGHCNCTSYTMNPYLVCANQFNAGSINEITAFANSLNCLSCSNQAPTGACCVGNSCIEIYESNCDAGGGIWQGDNTTCGASSCVAPQGACCVSGSCYEYEEDDCQQAGGDYAGDETNCNTVGCALGACCVGIDCSLTLLEDCSGSWYGDNTSCGDISCGAGADELNYELRTWSRSDGESMETYDVFFPSTDPNTRMVSVFGQDSDLLQIRGWSNAEFDGSASLVEVHHSSYGGDLAHDRVLDPVLGDDLVYDSYVTIGTDDAAEGLPNTLGFDSTGFNSAAGIFMDNGVWFVTPDSPLASMGAGTGLGHRITSISVEQSQGIEMLLNVQWYDGAGFVHETRNIYWNNYGLGGDTNDCPGDVDGSGVVNVSDLLLVISDWGPCGGCDSDVNEDGTVNVTDLLEIIASWGPCG